MSLFMCRECGCVENTACCNHWSAKADGTPQLCSECDPAIGKWHGQFEKRPAAGMLVDHNGYLWGSAQRLPNNFQIMGSVAARPSPPREKQ